MPGLRPGAYASVKLVSCSQVMLCHAERLHPRRRELDRQRHPVQPRHRPISRPARNPRQPRRARSAKLVSTAGKPRRPPVPAAAGKPPRPYRNRRPPLPYGPRPPQTAAAPIAAGGHRRRAEPRRLFMVAWLQTRWMVTKIGPFCAAPTDRAEEIVPVQNGGSSVALRLRSVILEASCGAFRLAVSRPGGCVPACPCLTGRLRRRRRRQCRWHAGLAMSWPGRISSWCGDRRGRRLPARRAAGPRRPVRR